MTSTSQSGSSIADPEVAATVQLLHRRQGWERTAGVSFMAFLLVGGSYSYAESQGTPPPFWFLVIVIVLGVLTAVGLVVAVLDSALLRRRPAAVQTQAGELARQHPSRPHAHHYPPRHRVSWAFRWLGMLLILAVAAVTPPGVVDGVAYLAGAEKTVSFDPVSYQTECSVRGGCETSTDGILETGGAGSQATWPDVVPLGKPFEVREPVWRWGLGEGLIDSDGIAVAAVLISLLIEALGVWVIVSFVRLTRNRQRHRRGRTETVASSASGPVRGGTLPAP